MLASYSILKFNKKDAWADYPKEHRYWPNLRNMLGMTIFTVEIYSAMLLPLFIMFIVYNTMPFWGLLIGWIVNKEIISYKLIGCMCGCFMGMVMLALSDINKEDEEAIQDKLNDKTSFYIGLGCVIFCAIFTCIFGALNRRMEKIHFSVLQFHYSALALFIFTCIIMPGDYLIETFSPNLDYGQSQLRIFTFTKEDWLITLLFTLLSIIENYTIVMAL